MSWIALAQLLIKLGLQLFESHKAEALKQAGEDREKLKQLSEMQAMSDRLRQVREENEKLSPVEVRAKLEKEGDFRD